ncbi:hypothetical protein [Dactylosporangium matsuzakiense]|uniref:Uncharacterized protein n=1 Tax=Dactylosporangium matsuzakiense TaxID=53360 RepID=A0A9W6KLU5_9ACTN|nr:hypothetical protein [Dactylosporangium matsuzakiense]UWZ41923.1 hypothetical protein Dmats_30400 [Dactylosporangium matsuzakiense]GLL04411.1 hypothetical protein GCM10017581_061580 [Dactylosporangium matsuzakiense]
MSYDGLVVQPAEPNGARGHYHQDGSLVWAEFAGGPVRTGRLVGTCAADGVINAAYCQVMADGAVVAGTCVSTPDRLADGRLRLTERWRRDDGSVGVSRIEEVPA